MATKIEWADETWNPVTGCTPISEGCANCYAQRMAQRLAGRCGYPADNPFKVTFHPDRLEQPLRWRKPRRVFVCSMGDLFHSDVATEHIIKVFDVMYQAPQHTYLILTKRPARMRALIEGMMDDGYWGPTPGHIWLGVTAENQEQANKRIPTLLQIPAAVRFISVEPMLGPVDLGKWFKETCTNCGGLGRTPNHPHLPSHICEKCGGRGKVYSPRLDWVICGGETGPGARPMHPDWARGLRDQCKNAGVPFFFKQWGEWLSVSANHPGIIYKDAGTGETEAIRVDGKIIRVIRWSDDGDVLHARVGKKVTGRLLYGVEHNAMPEYHND